MQEPVQRIFSTPRKIALVAFAQSTQRRAPFDAPDRDDWSIWGLNNLHRFLAPEIKRISFNAWWEMHPRAGVDRYEAYSEKDRDFYKGLRIPLFVQTQQPDWPMSVPYPLEQIQERFGPNALFHSTVCYQVALAIALIEDGQMLPTIGVYGVDDAIASNYENQRSALMWWLGQAQGRGIDVVIPEGCALFAPKYLYGYDAEENTARRHLVVRRAQLLEEITMGERDVNLAQQLIAQQRGALQEVEYEIFNWTLRQERPHQDVEGLEDVPVRPLAPRGLDGNGGPSRFERPPDPSPGEPRTSAPPPSPTPDPVA